jgi:signal transduction histidine kinase
VRALLADSLEALRPLARARGVELGGLRWSGEPVLVLGDRLRLLQATGNLIANAIEHGRGRVEVGGRTDGGRLQITVGDEGRGLPAPVADLTRRPRRGRGRRGRGLAIAADIARRHGGELTAPGAGQGGSRLALELPLRRG